MVAKNHTNHCGSCKPFSYQQFPRMLSRRVDSRLSVHSGQCWPTEGLPAPRLHYNTRVTFSCFFRSSLLPSISGRMFGAQRCLSCLRRAWQWWGAMRKWRMLTSSKGGDVEAIRGNCATPLSPVSCQSSTQSYHCKSSKCSSRNKQGRSPSSVDPGARQSVGSWALFPCRLRRLLLHRRHHIVFILFLEATFAHPTYFPTFILFWAILGISPITSWHPEDDSAPAFVRNTSLTMLLYLAASFRLFLFCFSLYTTHI